MKGHNDVKMCGEMSWAGPRNTRRDFLKMCGAATAGGMAGLLLPNGVRAEVPPRPLGSFVLQDAGDEFFWARVRRQFVLKPDR